MSTEQTLPLDGSADHGPHAAPRIGIAASYTAPDGSVYVHHDLDLAVEAWEMEEHIGPTRAQEKLGDVESWAKYVTQYGQPDTTLTTWNEGGLRAILDYHTKENGGRGAWHAEHRFSHSSQWLAWAALANGQPRSQRALIEALEDLSEDILTPAAGELLGLLRSLRATASNKASAHLAEDGSTNISYETESAIRSGGDVTLPPTLAIVIPVLKGHLIPSEDDPAVLVPRHDLIIVRLRAGVGDGAQMTFRLSMPGAERVMEDVIADRVRAAQDALGQDYALLRAASGQ
jgi:hypothetical protein